MHAVSDTAALDAAQNDGTRTIPLRIPAEAEYGTLCRLALSGLAQLRDISDETMAELKLALTEAVSNSVRHAYGEQGDGHVDITYRLQPDRLGIEVLDDGAGFDPDGPPAGPGRGGSARGRLRTPVLQAPAGRGHPPGQPGAPGSPLPVTDLPAQPATAD